MKKRIVNFLLVFSLLISVFPGSGGIKAVENPQQENKYGYVESNLKIYEQPSKLLKASVSLPSKFDLREESGVTSVKSQNPYGTCWTFASMATVESSLKYTTGKEVDLSEINLAIDRVGIAGLDRGGNFAMSTSYFANGSGPVLETDDPYPSGGQPVITKAPATYNVNNSLLLPSRTNSLDNNKIKEAIIDNGAVGISYLHDDAYLASDGVSYYYNEGTSSDHAVSLVGWDDNYPKEKFKNTPSGNGAFLVKNSWGTWFGESGYFYISYYDTSLGYDLILTTENTEAVKNVDNRYTYGKYNISYSTNMGISDQFIANVNQAKNNELLSALSIYAFSTNAPYDIYVDEDYNEINYPDGNINYILGKKRETGILQYGGFNTIKFDSPIEVQAGKRFMVAIKYKDATSPYLDFIDDSGKGNSFRVFNNKLLKNSYGANPLTVYSYNKNAESATDINIDKTSLALKIGEKSQIKANVIGNAYTSKSLKWTSSNLKVAVVDEDGVITGRGNGNSTITVSNRSGSIKKVINVSINTKLNMLSDFDIMLKDEKYIAFDEAITPSLDYSKIALKDKDGKILPISVKIDNRKLVIKVTSKYLGKATLSIPQNAIVNKVNKGLDSDKNIEILVDSYDETDHITLESKDLMKAVADELGKSEFEITNGDILKISRLNISCDDVDFKDVGLLSSLNYLTVRSNGNSRNIKDLKLLKNLKNIYFENVNMVNLNYLKNNSDLYYINLDGCKIFSLDGIENFINLSTAYFNNNYINDIKAVGKLNKLKWLSLDNNKITDISSLSSCTQLDDLNISNNKIVSLSGIENLKNLTTIEARNNGIKDLKFLENCTSINEMDFVNNQIEDLSPIKKLSELKADTVNLWIGYNYINNDDAISNYLVDIKKWDVYNYEKRAELYELNQFNISENNMNSKSALVLTFNREINKDWKIRFYHDENYNEVDSPFKVVGNKIFIENRLYDDSEKNNYYLYCDITYVDNNGVNQKIISGIDMYKTGFYTEDINKDKVVDIGDLAMVASQYNKTAVGEIENWQYDKDFNLDGVIDIYDLVYVSKAM